jgi:hypothetical protein
VGGAPWALRSPRRAVLDQFGVAGRAPIAWRTLRTASVVPRAAPPVETAEQPRSCVDDARAEAVCRRLWAG